METTSRLYLLLATLASLILFVFALAGLVARTYSSAVYSIAMLLLIVIGIAALLTTIQLYRIIEVIAKAPSPGAIESVEEVNVGEFGYKLEDPEHREAFDLFLDRPNVHPDDDGTLEWNTPQDEHYATESLYTPSAIFEKKIVEYARKIEEDSGDHVTVNVQIRRSSLEVIMVFSVLHTAYDIASNWKDFRESIPVIQQDVRRLFQEVNGKYAKQTGNLALLRGEATIEPPSRTTGVYDMAKRETASNGATNTNTINPANNDIKISINSDRPRTRVAGCFTVVIWLVMLSLVAVVGYCIWFSTDGVCRDLWYELTTQAASFFIRTAMFFDSVSGFPQY